MKKYVIVSALEKEFPFKDELNVIYTGIGKINATISLMTNLYKNSDIDNVINVGSAGGVSNFKNEVVSCGTFIDGDMNYPGYEHDNIVFNSDLYSISTFDSFQTKIPSQKCDCIDMESYAFAKICKLKKVNFFCFKYISDTIGDNKQESEWIENYHKGRFLLKESVMKLL